VRREIAFCRKIKLPIIGLIENMSGFVCPTCSECTNVFARGGGEQLAQIMGIAFIGRIPIDPVLAACVEQGSSFFERYPDSPSLDALATFVKNTIARDDEAEQQQQQAAQ
jgi:hypothetical protein